MKTQTRISNGIRAFLALGGSVMLSGSFCGPAQEGVIQQCRYELSNNWPSGERSFNPGNKASCPIKTPPGGRDQRYQAQAVLLAGSTTGSGSLQFLDYNGNFLAQGSVLFSGADIFTFTGSYRAGTIAAAPGTLANDVGLNSIALSGGGVATVSAKLGYQTTEAAAVLGPSYLQPGEGTTLSGEYYQSDLLLPVSFQWYKDGAAISGAIGETLGIAGGEPNESNFYEFRVTDAEARTVGAGRTVNTAAGCGTQLIC